MILDGQSIVDKSIVTFDDITHSDDQIQPNGIDLRLNKLWLLEGMSEVPREGKAKFEGRVTEQHPSDGWFHLRPQPGVYVVDFLETVHVRDGHVASIVTRSSLVRSGVDVVSGLWDTGFEGKLGASLRLINQVRLQWGAKLAQLVVSESEFNGKRYEGRYQSSDSQTALAT